MLRSLLPIRLMTIVSLFACISAAGAVLTVAPAEAQVGDLVTISGTTAFSPGNQVLVEVRSASFTPTNKSETSGFSGISGVVPVVEGTPYNRWTFTFDTANFRSDTYQVRVEVLETTAVQTTSFVLLPRSETTEATTTAASPIPTTTMPTMTATPVPTTPESGGSLSLLAAAAIVLLVLIVRRTRLR